MLGEVKAAESLQPLIAVAVTATDAELQRAALTAVAAFDDPAIGERLLAEFAKYSDEVRPAFFDLMLGRGEWTRQLVNGISSGAIDPSVVPRDVVAQLRRHPDAAIVELATRQFGAGDSAPVDSKQRIQQLRDILAAGTGNPYAGEATFMQQCAACHKLFHKGGNVGPDLTPYQRGNLETLLTSVLQPSAEIREGFEYVNLLTSDGRIIAGFVTDQDTQIVTLRVKAGEDVRVERADIESIAPVGRSIMPEGLLNDLSDQQLRDFFAYLRISQPISK
jgi:putative heme-binding domain-containing protein